MLLMSMIPAASAFAATAPAVVSVTLSSEQGTVAVGNTVSFTATAVQSGTGTPLYQFWYEGVNGNWHSTSWSTSNSFSLPPLKQGSYEVVVYAKDKGQAIPANSEGTNSNQFVNVDSSATLTAPTLTNVAPGTTLTFTASSKNLTDPVYQLWIQSPDGNWFASGDYQSSPTFQVTAALAGDYHAVLYAKDLNAPQTAAFSEYSKATFDAFGQAAAVKLSATSSSLVADGAASDTITAMVVDNNGNTVGNFNGTVTLTAPSGMTFANGLDTTTLTITNGTAAVTVTASTSLIGSESITTSGLVANSGESTASVVSYGSVTVTTVSPVATELLVSAATSTVPNNTSTSDTVTITLGDQAGNPLPTGVTSTFYAVTADVVGAGTLSGGASSTTEFVGDGAPASFTVYSEPDVAGSIGIMASAQNLATGTTTIEAVGVGQAAQLGVSSTTGTLSTATTYTVSSLSSFTLASGTTETTYTVTLEDAAGQAVTAPSTETFYLTDNATTGMAYVVTSSGSSGSATLIPQTGDTVAVTVGTGDTTATFTVVNTTTQASPATLTLTAASGDVANTATDAPLSTTASTSYMFVTGPAYQLGVTGTESIAEGKSATYTAQVEDSVGNPVADANAVVTFTITGSGTFANGATTLTELTNASGAASVTVDAATSVGTTTSTYTVSATISQTVADPTGTVTATVTSPAATVAELGLSVVAPTGSSYSGTTLTLPGLSAATATITEENAIQTQISGTDSLQVSTSNGDVVLDYGGTIETGTTLSISGSTISAASGVATFEVVGGTAGTATVTVTDTSDPSVAPVSFTVDVQPLASSTMSAATETGTGNASGDTAAVTVNGNPVTADYAASVTDFATYNQATGEFTVLTPVIEPSVTISNSSGVVTTATVAVWEVAGSAYYVALDETPGTGAAASTDYVGVTITSPYSGSNVEMAVNSGAYDGNSGTTDSAYVAIATENSSGTWTVAPSQSFVVNTKVSLTANGPTVVYPVLMQQP